MQCGVEIELIGFKDWKRLKYPDVLNVLKYFSANCGWSEHYEHGVLVSLSKGKRTITLEPGVQLEYGSAETSDLSNTFAQVLEFQNNLKAASAAHGYKWLSLGFDPFSSKDFSQALSYYEYAKQRYVFMSKNLPKLGPKVLNVMYGSAAWQVSVDYKDADDLALKLAASQVLAVLGVELSANSRIVERSTGEANSTRSAYWSVSDKKRTGLLPFAFKPKLDVEGLVSSLADLPMLLIQRGDEQFDPKDMSLRQFYKNGLGNLRYEKSDWDMHTRSVFTHTRVKKVLEIRSMDSMSVDLGFALTSWICAILYDEKLLKIYADLAFELGFAKCNLLLEAAVAGNETAEHKEVQRLAGESISAALTSSFLNADSKAKIQFLDDFYKDDQKNVASKISAWIDAGNDLTEGLRKFNLVFA